MRCEDRDGSSDLLIIRPDNLVIKTPIRIFYQEERIDIDNLLTFFSFRRVSDRLRRRIELAVGRTIRRFVRRRGYGGAEPNVTVVFSEKTSKLSVELPDESIIEKKDIMGLAKAVFSRTCQDIPEYAVREYRLLPVLEEYLNFFVLLIPYRPELRETLQTLKSILSCPFVTLPGPSGEYYSSMWNEDSLYGPPSAVRRILVYEKNRSAENEDAISQEFVASILKELAHLTDPINDAEALQEILNLTSKILGQTMPSVEEVRNVINHIRRIVGGRKAEALSKLCEYLNGLLERAQALETLENIYVTRAVLRRIMRILTSGERGIGRGGASIFRSYLLAGRVLSRRKKRLINLGAGKAIYLSPKEWRTITSTLSDIENIRVEMKIVSSNDGRRSIVIEFLEE